MSPITTPTIAMSESNQLDGMYFMSLTNGEKFQSKKWEQLTLNDNVIEMVKGLAFEQGQPDMPDKIPIFTWEPDIDADEPINDVEDDNEDVSTNNEPIDLGFIDPRVENIVPDEDDSDGGYEHPILESNAVEDQAADEPNVALGATLIIDEDVVGNDNNDLPPTEDIPNVQGDTMGDDHSAHSSEWSFNPDNVLDEIHNDTVMAETIDDTDGGINRALVTDTIASSRPRRENSGMGIERPDVGL
jgi:hypothetical protein